MQINKQNNSSCYNNYYQKVYKLYNNYTKSKLIYKIPHHDLNYWIHYFNNNTEIVIIFNNSFVLIDNNEEIKTLPFKYNVNHMRDIIKHKNDFYILMKSKIIILDSDLNFRDYDILYNLEFNNKYKTWSKIIIYNDELFITYYNGIKDLQNEYNTIINLILIKIDLSNKVYTYETLFTCHVSTFLNNENMFMDGYQIQSICAYNEYIIYFINDSVTHDMLLINYNLLTKKLNHRNIKEKCHVLADDIKNYNYMLFLQDSLELYNKSFVIYDMRTLEFVNYIRIDKIPIQGHVNILINNNTLIMTTNRDPKKSTYMIYQMKNNKKTIYLGALWLKYGFKNTINIGYGEQSDIKELILEKMDCNIKLDENDKIIEYKNNNINFIFQRELTI